MESGGKKRRGEVALCALKKSGTQELGKGGRWSKMGKVKVKGKE